MRVLCIGDVIGRPGRRVLREMLPQIQRERLIDFTIANGENLAGGFGIIPEKFHEMENFHVDLVTTGNHIWDRKEIVPFLDHTDRLLRPLNYPPGTPGRGYTVVPAATGVYIGVLNLQGRVFMPNIDCPFRAAEAAIEELRRKTPVVFVDFHAEATSEKVAMGRFLDGKVTAVFGTHTHVQTADDQVLPGGTAYITDLGMTGAHESVIGMEVEGSIRKFLTAMPGKLNPENRGLRLNGLVVEVDPETGRALAVERLNLPLPG
jgi:metallophosphoesterase (TIGR00282 family)